ncbi:MAG: MurR/RpiR family transcriptional regulator [Clostridiales bacterium]|nr:MurR/RpiR family transcriptional regulator [Clostridiales bacterium]
MFYYENIQELNELETQIYHYVHSHAQQVVNMTIRQLAEQVSVSTSSILRFCIKMNCSGYSEFRYQLKQTLARHTYIEENVYNSKAAVNFFKGTEVLSFMEKVSHMTDLISERNRIYFLGQGVSSIMCQYGAWCLSCAGKQSFQLESRLIPYIHVLPSQDVVLMVLSNGEENEAFLQQVSQFQWAGAACCCITNTEGCILSRMADVSICCHSAAEPLTESGEWFSQAPVVYVLELLMQKVRRKGKEARQEKDIPSG